MMNTSKPEFSSIISWLLSKVQGYPLCIRGISLLWLGFFRSISLQPENTLQDSLRLLTLWFKFGGADQVSGIVREGLATVPVDTWLQVIPQVRHRAQGPTSLLMLLSAHRSNPNSVTEYSKHDQSPPDRSRKGSPTSAYLSLDRRFQVHKYHPSTSSRYRYVRSSSTQPTPC